MLGLGIVVLCCGKISLLLILRFSLITVSFQTPETEFLVET
jgi:hypothetical protein